MKVFILLLSMFIFITNFTAEPQEVTTEQSKKTDQHQILEQNNATPCT